MSEIDDALACGLGVAAELYRERELRIKAEADCAALRAVLTTHHWHHRCSDGVGGCTAVSDLHTEDALASGSGAALIERLRTAEAERDGFVRELADNGNVVTAMVELTALRAEVERMRPVCDAAVVWAAERRELNDASLGNATRALIDAAREAKP